jgi:hypothetical protein
LRRPRDKTFLISVYNIRRRCLGRLRRLGDHRAHQQHLGHAIMPPIVLLAKQASTRTSPMRPSECRLRNRGRAEDRRGGFVIHDYAARCMGDPRAAGLRNMRRTGYNGRLGRSGCDFALITHGDILSVGVTAMTERMRRGLTWRSRVSLRRSGEGLQFVCQKSSEVKRWFEKIRARRHNRRALGFLWQRVIGGG